MAIVHTVLPVCKRCLLAEMGGREAEYYQSVLNYRKKLPPAKATDEASYQQRIAACKACESLVNGVCNQCGCYVEMRAAAKQMHCPKPGQPLW